MRPGEFGIAEAEFIIDDWRRRIITDKARKDAEEGTEVSAPEIDPSLPYWDQIVIWMEYVVYVDAYERRRKRLDRMKTDD